MSLLHIMRNGLVVSCQPVDNGPMDRPDIVAAMAEAALAGGAKGVRIEGAQNVRATRQRISAPIIGIIKRDLPKSPVRITPFLEDVRALAAAGADVIAFDATARDRPVPRAELTNEISQLGLFSMADCASLADARHAVDLGVGIIGTTLSGYTEETKDRGPEPDFEFVARAKKLGAFVMAEGRYATPALAAKAFAFGADCVTVGTPLTRLELNTADFREAIAAQVEKDD